jgi:phage nucleotide-binding protein
MNITSTNTTDNTRISCLVYGLSGVGKTTLAKTLDGKTLIISAESGLLSLRKEKIDVVVIEGDKVQSLREIVGELKKGVAYDNIFFDSISEISQIFLEYYQQQFQERKDNLVLFGEVAKSLRAFIKLIRDMNKYNIIVTALEKPEKDDLGRIFYTPDLVGKMSKDISQYFDEVFNLKKFTTEDKEERLLITDYFDGRICKDRSGSLNKFEPANLSLIFNKIRGVTNV